MPELANQYFRISRVVGGLLLLLACTPPESVLTPPPTTLPYTAWLTGDSTDVRVNAQPGLVLAGGSTDVDEAMRWLLARSGGGDVVVLRASGADGYNRYLFAELGVPVHSVETLLINSREVAAHPDVVRKIRNAEALFIAGGDQANYLMFWQNTPTAQAINYLLTEKRVPVGGTSAGCAVLGRLYFTAATGTVQSAEALLNPYHPAISLDRDRFLAAPFLENTFTDMHFQERDRRGRLVTFLARAGQDWQVTRPRGIGVDEKTALCLDETGTGRVYGRGGVTLLEGLTPPTHCRAGQPLDWRAPDGKAIRATHLTAGQRWDFPTWTGEGRAGYLTVVDGKLSE